MTILFLVPHMRTWWHVSLPGQSYIRRSHKSLHASWCLVTNKLPIQLRKWTSWRDSNAWIYWFGMVVDTEIRNDNKKYIRISYNKCDTAYEHACTYVLSTNRVIGLRLCKTSTKKRKRHSGVDLTVSIRPYANMIADGDSVKRRG